MFRIAVSSKLDYTHAIQIVNSEKSPLPDFLSKTAENKSLHFNGGVVNYKSKKAAA